MISSDSTGPKEFWARWINDEDIFTDINDILLKKKADYQVWAYDMNSDGIIDILDLLKAKLKLMTP